MDWDRLRVFHAVVEAGSFTNAGHRLKLSQSAISRQISALEKAVKVSLFYRRARGLVLTEQGEELFKTVQEMSSRLSLALATLNENKEQPEGPLRLTTTVTFGSAWLASRISEFHLMFPDISVSLLLTDEPELDLTSGKAEVAIRFARQTLPDMIERKLLTIRYHVFASKVYLKKYGTPKTPVDLDQHKLIVYGSDVVGPFVNMNWLLEAGASPGCKRKPTLRVTSVYGIYRAVKSGLGIAALPYYLTEESPELVQILPELRGPDMEAYFVYPDALRDSKRVAVIRDFLLQQAEVEKGEHLN